MNGRAMDGIKHPTEEYVPTERSAMIVFFLMQGSRLSTAEIARLTGLTPQGAWNMLQKICRVVPLYQEGGVWIFRDEK